MNQKDETVETPSNNKIVRRFKQHPRIFFAVLAGLILVAAAIPANAAWQENQARNAAIVAQNAAASRCTESTTKLETSIVAAKKVAAEATRLEPKNGALVALKNALERKPASCVGTDKAGSRAVLEAAIVSLEKSSDSISSQTTGLEAASKAVAEAVLEAATDTLEKAVKTGEAGLTATQAALDESYEQTTDENTRTAVTEAISVLRGMVEQTKTPPTTVAGIDALAAALTDSTAALVSKTSAVRDAHTLWVQQQEAAAAVAAAEQAAASSTGGGSSSWVPQTSTNTQTITSGGSGAAPAGNGGGGGSTDSPDVDIWQNECFEHNAGEDLVSVPC